MPRLPNGDQFIERRWVARLPLRVRVNLYRNRSIIRNSIATDFSICGVFLRCHYADMYVGNEISLAIPDISNGVEKWYFAKVQVVRVAENGVGIKFLRHDCQTFSCINKLVHIQNNQNNSSGMPGMPDSHAAA